MERESIIGTDIGIKLLLGYSVMRVCYCIPRHIHCSCSTVMALSYIPLYIRACFLCFFCNPYMSLFNSKNVYLLVSTLFSFASSKLHVNNLHVYIHDHCQQLYHPVLKHTISWNCYGYILINSGTLLHKKN